MAALSSTSYLRSLVGHERHFFPCKTSQFSKPLSISPSLNKPRFSVPFCIKQSDRDQKLTKQESSREEKNEEEEDYWVVTAVRSKYNEIVIVDTVDARYLLLDSTKKTHSVINKGGENWTDSYEKKTKIALNQVFVPKLELKDEFASLPPIVPDGPIAIYGLGGGTAARLILELYPSTQLEGWEIDDILIEKAREYMELSELEKLTSKGGSLRVLIDDALSPSEDVSGKYAGIIVDLFADGKVLDQLQQVQMWHDLASRLMPNGRIMVNCAGIKEVKVVTDEKPQLVLGDSVWMLNPSIKVMSEAFPGQVCWKRTPDSEGLNFVALTGGVPDLSDWSSKVPVRLSETVKQWKLCQNL